MATVLKFFETGVDSILTDFKANLNTRITDLNDNYGGERPLALLGEKDFYDYEEGDPDKYPMIVLVGDRLKIIGGDFNSIETDELLSLWFWMYEDIDEKHLRRMQYRYASAIWIALRAWEVSAGQTSYTIRPDAEFEFELIPDPDERKAWAAFRLQFTLTRHENI